jgi:hypothetical protein
MSTTSSAYDGSPARTAIILDKPTDWDEWLFIIKEKAQSTDVWQYANPDLVEQPTPPQKPTRPIPSDIKEDALTPSDLDTEGKQALTLLRDDYKVQEKEYQLLSKGLKDLNSLICTTISRTNLTYILRNCDTPYAKLKALKRRLAPTDRARELELIHQYNELKKPPTSHGIDKWLQQWEKIYTDALAIKLPDVQKDRPLYDFLQAIKGLDASFSAASLTRIMTGEAIPTLYDLIKQFRNIRRISSASDKAYSPSHSPSHSAFPTFQGMQDKTTPPSPCICGRNHFFKECYYLIEQIRPHSWKPDAQIMRTIQEKLANDTRLAIRITRARNAAQKGATNTQNNKGIATTPTKDNPQNNLTIGAFTATYTASSNYKLQNHWILDSGSDIHVCSSATGFTPTRTATAHDQLHAGKTAYDIESFGTLNIDVYTPQGPRKMTLLDVVYVPGFMTNLVSLSRLVQKGVHWDTAKACLHRDGNTLCYVYAYDGHWVLNKGTPASVSAYPAYSTQPKPTRTLPASHWHQILGHANQDAIHHLSTAVNGTQISLRDAPTTTECESCSLSKAKQLISRRTDQEEPATRPFDRVSYDLIPMTEAYNGDKWISHFKCYVTSMNHVYTHPQKSNANSILKEYVQMVKTRHSATIRFMRLDGERTLGAEFDTLTREHGISTERTAPYTPAQNGHAERSGGVIITTARTMRIHARLPENLWPEIVRTAGYLLNRTPIRVNEWKTPFEAVTGHQPNLAHLYTYGCRAYALTHGIPKLQKLKQRATISYLVGYDSTNIYRIWYPAQNKVVRTRDATFHESEYYDPTKQQDSSQLREAASEILEVIQDTNTRSLAEDQDSTQDTDTDDPDTIVVQPITQNTTRHTTQDTHQSTYTKPIALPTPELTPEPSTSQETALRAAEISADFSDTNVLPEGSRRSVRKRAYAAALTTAPTTLNGYYGAFIAAISQEKATQRLHRDSLPIEPKNWRQMLKHPYATEFKQAAQSEYDALVKRSTFTPILRSTIQTNVLPLLWVFTYKFDTDGYLLKFKARICVRGDLQATDQDTYAATLTC